MTRRSRTFRRLRRGKRFLSTIRLCSFRPGVRNSFPGLRARRTGTRWGSRLRDSALRLRVVQLRAPLRARRAPPRARWVAPGAAVPQVWSEAQRRPRRLHPRLGPSTSGIGPRRWGAHGGGASGAGDGSTGRTTPGGAPGRSQGGSARAGGSARLGDARHAGAAGRARPTSGRSVGRRGGPAVRAPGAVLAATGRPLRLGRGGGVPHLGTRTSMASPRLRLHRGLGRPRQFFRGVRGCGPLGADADRRRSRNYQAGLQAGPRYGHGRGEPNRVLGHARSGLAFRRRFLLPAFPRGPRWGQGRTDSGWRRSPLAGVRRGRRAPDRGRSERCGAAGWRRA